MHESFNLSEVNHAITISSVQDACLDHAEIWGALQKFKNNIFPPFPSFKNIEITS